MTPPEGSQLTKYQLAIMQGYLSEEEEKRFWRNHIELDWSIKKYLPLARTPDDVIRSAFNWRESPEGQSYWENIVKQIRSAGVDIHTRDLKEEH